MTFSAAPSGPACALHLHRDDDVHPFGHGRELPAGDDGRHAAGDRAFLVVGRARHPVRQHVPVLGQRQPHADVAGPLAGQRQRIEAGVQRAAPGTAPWPGSAVPPRTGVASAGMAKRSSTSVIACAICTEPISVASAAIGVPSAAERATPPDRPRGHPAQPLGQREQPAAPVAVRRLITKVQVPISTRTLPCGGSGRCTGTGADERLDRHAGVLVLERTGHPRHQPQLVVAARAAKQLDLGHRERVGLDVRAQPVAAQARPNPARGYVSDRACHAQPATRRRWERARQNGTPRATRRPPIIAPSTSVAPVAAASMAAQRSLPGESTLTD